MVGSPNGIHAFPYSLSVSGRDGCDSGTSPDIPTLRSDPRLLTYDHSDPTSFLARLLPPQVSLPQCIPLPPVVCVRSALYHVHPAVPYNPLVNFFPSFVSQSERGLTYTNRCGYSEVQTRLPPGIH